MNKIPCTSQNMEAKTLPANVCLWLLWTAFTSCCPLSWQLICEWSGGSMFHPLSHIYSKTHFSCVETVANNTLNWLTVSKPGSHFEHNFLIDKCLCKMVKILPSIFNSSAISYNFNLRLAKMSLWSFLVFSVTTAEFWWLEHSASFVSVRPPLKSP